MKKSYTTPIVDVVTFEADDIVMNMAASGGNPFIDDDIIE